MEVTGTVTKRIRRSTSCGSRYVTVTLARPGTPDIRLTWLHTFQPMPEKGQVITVTGMPMQMRPRRGSIRTNIGAVAITIREQETP